LKDKSSNENNSSSNNNEDNSTTNSGYENNSSNGNGTSSNGGNGNGSASSSNENNNSGSGSSNGNGAASGEAASGNRNDSAAGSENNNSGNSNDNNSGSASGSGSSNGSSDGNANGNGKKDKTAPTINLNGANPQIIEFGNDYEELGADVKDNKDKDLVLSIDSSSVDTTKLGEYKVVYSTEDSDGNRVEVVRVVKVVDTTAPTITLKGDNIVNLSFGEEYIETGYSATDNYDGNLTSLVKIENNVNINKTGSYTIIYSVVDSSGNEVSVVRTVIVGEPYAYIPKELDNYIAVRFLNKATFGATKDSIAELKEKGILNWLDNQLNMPLSDSQLHLRTTINIAKQFEPSSFPDSVDDYLADNDIVFNKSKASFQLRRYQNSAWFTVSLFQKDQLREKVTYALSQIIVESLAEPIFTRRAEAISRYFDILRDNAFGNYKNLLLDISHSSSMSLYLTFNGNKKEHTVGDSIVYPDENYAREIMQLFSIGLYELNLL